MPQCGQGPGTSLATPGHIGQTYNAGPPALAGRSEVAAPATQQECCAVSIRGAGAVSAGRTAAAGVLQQSWPAFSGAGGSVIPSL
jgi:hypothetical protein